MHAHLKGIVPLLVVSLLAPSAFAQATNCVCSGFNKSRTESEWSFPEGTYFSRARTNLRDPAYFGATGVVDVNIVIAQSGVQSAIGTLSGVNVFFTGLARSESYTTNEKSALRAAVESGMNLVITADDLEHSISDVFGVTLSDSLRDPDMNTALASEHQILAGPFGKITRFRGAGDAGYFRGWPAGTLVLAANVEGPTMLLIPRGVLSGSSGAVLLISDSDQLTTYLRATEFNNSEPSIPVTDALFMNIVAFLCRPSAPASAPHLVFPQIANGERNVSSLNITNSDIVENIARITFRDDDGLPFNLNLVELGAASTFDRKLDANQTLTFTTDGAGSLRSGTALVRGSSPDIAGTVMFFVPGLGATGVAASEAAGGFVLPVVRQPTSTTPIEVFTGVAVSNLSAKPCNLRLELWDESNRRSDGIMSRTIPAYGHFAAFLYQLFPGFDFRGFRGTLRLVSADALISAAGLQLGSAAGQFTALPIKAQYR